MTIMKKIIERIFKNLLGILNEDKRTKIIRANWHIEANKSRKDLLNKQSTQDETEPKRIFHVFLLM